MSMIRMKLLLVFLFGWTSVVIGQTMKEDSAEVFKLEAINWQLDSLLPCYHFQCVAPEKYDRKKLNVNNFPQDSVPVFSPEQLAARLKGMKTVIPMEYNSYVHAYINMYATRRRDQVERMLGLSHIYFPIFETELDRRGMPIELKYLPVVESALNPHARSRVGATGLWQFMLATGKIYGLEVDSYIDERKDPYKSTEAAARYLSNMYKTYGDWLLVIAAYNCGPGNVNKAIARSGGKRTFWEIRENLPRETRGYVPAFIAATYIFNYHAEHNLFPRKIDFSFDQDTLQVTRQKFSLKHLSQITGADIYTLKDLNPELQRDIVPYTNQAYTLRVPMATGQLCAAFRDSIFGQLALLNPDTVNHVYAETVVSPLTNKPYISSAASTSGSGSANAPAGKSLIYHKVRSGETVSQIAARYRVSWDQVKAWNHLRGYNIKPGQKLKVYVPSNSRYAQGSSSSSTPKSTTPAITSTSGGKKYYTVRSGDTLWEIAQAQGTTVTQIRSLNSLSSSKLKVGQKLRLN